MNPHAYGSAGFLIIRFISSPYRPYRQVISSDFEVDTVITNAKSKFASAGDVFCKLNRIRLAREEFHLCGDSLLHDHVKRSQLCNCLIAVKYTHMSITELQPQLFEQCFLRDNTSFGDIVQGFGGVATDNANLYVTTDIRTGREIENVAQGQALSFGLFHSLFL